MFGMTQLEFYKSFQFMAELLIIEGMFTMRLRRRSYFWIRLPICIAACFVFSWLFPMLDGNAFYFSFMFIALFAFTVGVSKLVFKETWLTLLFCCIAGYTTQHLAYELYNLSLSVMGVSGNTSMGFYGSGYSLLFSNPFIASVYFYIYIVTYYFSFFFFGRKIKKREPVQLKNSFLFLFVILIVTVDVLFNALVVYYVDTDGQTLYMTIVGLYNILCCIVALYLQFEVALRRRLETTLDTVQQIWHQVKEQYAVSKENIALINMKCHDLKQQIRSLGSENMISSSFVKEIEKRISIYDSTVKTGNDALDIILTEKSLLCRKNDIRLNCIVDGGHLDFMAEEDIYSMFGNIVDNAIEAVLKLEQEKRVIGLRVKMFNNLLSVRAYNYFNADLQFVDGMPKTTKEDNKYHGFGIKSMQYICEKYDGNISIKVDNNVFYVNIFFPLS